MARGSVIRAVSTTFTPGRRRNGHLHVKGAASSAGIGHPDLAAPRRQGATALGRGLCESRHRQRGLGDDLAFGRSLPGA